ncbi:hypothetical protein [Roseibacillus ishigakijimensis]|uniref:Ribulose-phosphate 3-epimerase n=1 Tax=Roseibacillus ishigakijimensis TaxID=454146 RepID=A0A934RKR4_9BACT|nr:hypothetical protein [Roseibacillus ishigakijimensis]MBK1833219.1 hypothetical protein [Roseibacillus ishigakijimensis]
MSRQATIDHLRANHPQLTIGTLTTDDQLEAVQILRDHQIPLLHIDIMDGQVWPKATVGPEFLSQLGSALLKDVHLLVAEPEVHIPLFTQAGADLISFSIEYSKDIAHCLQLITDGGDQILRGVSLNPDTDLALIQPHLADIDFVILLAIGPETGKETFFDTLPAKVKQLREWKPELLITIDGAIKKDNVGEVAKMGSDFIATGSAVFDGVDPAANITFMKGEIASAQA